MGIIQMSIVGSILIIVIAVIRVIALNKLPKKTFLILWGIVLLRLLIPFSVPSQLSVYNAFDLNLITQKKQTENPLIDKSNASGVETSKTETIITIHNAETIPSEETKKNFESTGATSTVLLTKNQEPIINPLIAVWLIGAVSYAIFFTIIFIKTNKILRFALPLHSNWIIDKWIAENKLQHRVSILQTDMIKTPIAVGIFKPRIILPKTMDLNNEQLLLYVLAHEYFHIKRFDIVWKIICVVAICVHWFNPFVWLMSVFFWRDLELACDEEVLCLYGEDKKQFYAYSIINMSEQISKINPLYNNFSKNKTAERITAIMKYKNFSISTITVAALLIAGTTVAFALDSSDSTSRNHESSISENKQNNTVDIETTNAEKINIEHSENNNTASTENPDFEKEYQEYQTFVDKQSLALSAFLSAQSIELQKVLDKQSEELSKFLNDQEKERRVYYDKPELEKEFQILLNEQESKLQVFLNKQDASIHELTNRFDNEINNFVSKQEKNYNDWLDLRPNFKEWLKEKENN